MTEVLDKSAVSNMQSFVDELVQQATEAGMIVNGRKTKEILTDRLEIDQDNLPIKFLPLNVDFNGVSFDPLGSRSHPYECIKFVYPLQNTRFLLLSTNLATERLQMHTDLLRIITSTADRRAFRGIPITMTLNDFEIPK